MSDEKLKDVYADEFEGMLNGKMHIDNNLRSNISWKQQELLDV